MLKTSHFIIKRERLHLEISLSYPHSKRKLLVKYSGTYVDYEVLHSYFLAKILGVIYSFSHIKNTYAHILTREI